MTQNIECDAAISDAVLQAARAAMPADPGQWFADRTFINCLPEKQRSLVPLLISLLDAADAVAQAINDNAADDGAPLQRQVAEGLAGQAYRVGGAITNAWQVPAADGWSLPSMSGKELV